MINSFDQSLPMILYRALDAVMPRHRALFARYDLTEQQWRIMRVLWETDRIVSTELAARTLLQAPSLVGIIDRLERKQLVSRVRSVDDRRVVFIVATAAGRALAEEVMPQLRAIQIQIRSSVSEAEWAAMEAALAKIAGAMTAGETTDAATG